jgi:hypothetical protein
MIKLYHACFISIYFDQYDFADLYQHISIKSVLINVPLIHVEAGHFTYSCKRLIQLCCLSRFIRWQDMDRMRGLKSPHESYGRFTFLQRHSSMTEYDTRCSFICNLLRADGCITHIHTHTHTLSLSLAVHLFD